MHSTEKEGSVLTSYPSIMAYFTHKELPGSVESVEQHYKCHHTLLRIVQYIHSLEKLLTLLHNLSFGAFPTY